MGNWIARLESWTSRHRDLIGFIGVLGVLATFLAAVAGYSFHDFISDAVKQLPPSTGQQFVSFLIFLAAQPWFWFVVGLLIGLLLGVWLGGKSEAKSALERTRVEIDYEKVDGENRVETKDRVYVRARVRNAGRGTAKNVQIFLTSIEKVIGTGNEPTAFSDSKLLPWAGWDFKPRDLPPSPDAHFYVDLMSVSKSESGWFFSVQKIFESQAELKNYKGTLQFRLLATADNAEPAKYAVNVNYYGDWHHVDARPASV